jgi:hypothetical protein
MLHLALLSRSNYYHNSFPSSVKSLVVLLRCYHPPTFDSLGEPYLLE